MIHFFISNVQKNLQSHFEPSTQIKIQGLKMCYMLQQSHYQQTGLTRLSFVMSVLQLATVNRKEDINGPFCLSSSVSSLPRFRSPYEKDALAMMKHSVNQYICHCSLLLDPVDWSVFPTLIYI